MDGASVASQRTPQHVNTLSDRKKVMEWMVDRANDTNSFNIPSMAVDRFSKILSSSSRAASRRKAARWFNMAHEYLERFRDEDHNSGSLTTHIHKGCTTRRVHMKALAGSGPERSAWKTILYCAIEEEFKRFRSLGIKMSTEIVQEMALALVLNPTVPVSAAEIFEDTGLQSVDVLSVPWVRSFLESKNIVLRKRTGKLKLSAHAEVQMKRSMAYVLGTLKRAYDHGLDCAVVENYDKCHFTFDQCEG